jgi:hypothetical protein
VRTHIAGNKRVYLDVLTLKRGVSSREPDKVEDRLMWEGLTTKLLDDAPDRLYKGCADAYYSWRIEFGSLSLSSSGTSSPSEVHSPIQLIGE